MKIKVYSLKRSTKFTFSKIGQEKKTHKRPKLQKSDESGGITSELTDTEEHK